MEGHGEGVEPSPRFQTPWALQHDFTWALFPPEKAASIQDSPEGSSFFL